MIIGFKSSIDGLRLLELLRLRMLKIDHPAKGRHITQIGQFFYFRIPMTKRNLTDMLNSDSDPAQEISLFN
jgi:hypothetical protein